MRTLDGFVRAGKIRYYGFSNFTGWQLTKAVHIARAHGFAEPVTLQPQYSLIVREIEWEVVPAALDAGLGLLPWSPLGGGWLSGKYRRDQRPTGETRLGEDPGRGMEAWERRGTERTWRIIEAVERIAEGHGVPMSRVALAWVTNRPAVTATILGARTLVQLDDNLLAADLHLSEEETSALDEASDLGASRLPVRRTRRRPASPGPRRQLSSVNGVSGAPVCEQKMMWILGHLVTQRPHHLASRTAGMVGVTRSSRVAAAAARPWSRSGTDGLRPGPIRAAR